MQLCKGKKANDIWVFVLNFSTIVPPDGRQTLHPYQLVLKSICLSYFFLQCRLNIGRCRFLLIRNTLLLVESNLLYYNFGAASKRVGAHSALLIMLFSAIMVTLTTFCSHLLVFANCQLWLFRAHKSDA